MSEFILGLLYAATREHYWNWRLTRLCGPSPHGEAVADFIVWYREHFEVKYG